MRVPTNQSGCSTNYEYVCGGFANGCSIASICIARILIQIKLLTRLLPLGMTSCLNIPPSNWWWCCCLFVLLLFRFARLPPKQINEQNNRTNTVQKYSRLKKTYTHTPFFIEWFWVSVCFVSISFSFSASFLSLELTFSQSKWLAHTAIRIVSHCWADFQMLLLYLHQLSGSNWLETKQSTTYKHPNIYIFRFHFFLALPLQFGGN